ncbi:protein gamete expressed 1 isoform X1 [Tanacetum coccineum]|uniref:Protein gamete expressed 1 isoform X1 n=1 Tax=Tanacetum coccineum TaxID=301880 RepID=A0ABQ5ASE4_9ASTR
MSYHKHFILVTLWILVLLSQSSESFSWFFSSGKADSSENPSEFPETSRDLVAEFSMESLNSKKGMMLVEKARRKASLSNSCWQKAYQNLFAGCSEILAREEQRSRLAWHLSDCFQKDTGRSPFPYCDVKLPMVNCLKKLDEDAHRVYLEFYLETNAICHQLQTDAFKRQTERCVNELKASAEFAENKLKNIEEQARRLLHTSDNIHDSLYSIDVQTQELAQTSKIVEERVSIVLEHSHSVYEQSIKIADSQLELCNRQISMNERLDEGMTMLNESANKLDEGMHNLRNEAVEIGKEIGEIGDAMFMKMNTLQTKADDIENIAETTLGRQKQLLEHQTTTLEVLQTMTSFQSQALEESRGTLQRLIELGQNQQQELIKKQEQLKEAHEHLVENSKTILAAQELFESKQASLCVTFLIEFMVLRYGNDIDQQSWIIRSVRLLYVLLASCQLLYAIYTYRDYETINHQMLQSLIDKVNGMLGNKQLLYEDEDDDLDWSSWVDTDLPEDELEDVDFILPEEVKEALICTSASREYNLRHRRQ